MPTAKKYLTIFTLLFLCISSVSARPKERPARVSKPLLWVVSHYGLMKKYTTNSKTYHNAVETANLYCTQSPIVVTDKKTTLAPDKHYYYSIGPYWWPDPQNPDGPYINQDGSINPEYYDYDAQVLIDFVDRCELLSIAYFFTENDKYYDAFVRQLRAWFVDEETLMYPNFEYSQVIKGHYNNKGRGKIEAYEFVDLIESIRMVSLIRPIERNTLVEVQKWFDTFADWLENAYGPTMRRIQNNVTLAYDVMLTDMYMFAGQNKKAKAIARTFAKRRIKTQINENGEQPAELVRASSVTYSIFNLNHILDYCYIVRQWYPRLYKQNQVRLDAAMLFLINTLNNPKDYKYSQKSGFDHCRSSLKNLLRRRSDLLGGDNSLIFE